MEDEAYNILNITSEARSFLEGAGYMRNQHYLPGDIREFYEYAYQCILMAYDLLLKEFDVASKRNVEEVLEEVSN